LNLQRRRAVRPKTGEELPSERAQGTAMPLVENLIEERFAYIPATFLADEGQPSIIHDARMGR